MLKCLKKKCSGALVHSKKLNGQLMHCKVDVS